jgi:4'-phosphopantetheinyl transferase
MTGLNSVAVQRLPMQIPDRGIGSPSAELTDCAIRSLALTSLEIQLFLVDLNAYAFADTLNALSKKEHDLAARLAFEQDRHHYLAAHCALRSVLSQHLSIDQSQLAFDQGVHGKPFVAGHQSCMFNMSHSGGYALIGIGLNAEIGVDIEAHRQIRDAGQLKSHIFSAAEQRAHEAIEPALQDEALLRGWTRKEACLKALGYGLTISPAGFETGFAESVQRVQISSPDGTKMVDVESVFVAPGLSAAVARVVKPDSQPIRVC